MIENIEGFEIYLNDNSKRIINIDISDEILNKLIFPFNKFDITALEYKPFTRFTIAKSLDDLSDNKLSKFLNKNENISFIKDSFLQYNRIDHNKNFENFIVGESNKLAFEASKKVTENLAHYNPLYIYGGVGMGKTHLLNAIGFILKGIFFIKLIK